MNILVVHCRYRISGGEDRVVSCDIKLLREMGHKVVPYISSNKILDGAGTIARVKCVAAYLYPAKQRQEIIRIIKKDQIDVIWVHNTLWTLGTAPYEAGKKCGIPVIHTLHNFRLLCPNGICYREGHICRDCIGRNPLCLHNSVKRGCYRNSRLLSAVIAFNIIKQRKSLKDHVKLVCVSEFQRKLILKSLKGLNPKKVYIKHNFVSSTVNSKTYSERSNRFIYAGRLTESKGIKELLCAWKILEKDMPDAPELLICGTGELAGFADEFIQENRLRHVKRTGEISGEEVSGLMADSKALIYPTRWYEGEPVAIIEAYYAGTPVIATDIGGVSEMILEGRTGIKLSYDDQISDIVNIISNWDRLYTYDIDSICRFSGKFSKNSSIKAIRAILEA